MDHFYDDFVPVNGSLEQRRVSLVLSLAERRVTGRERVASRTRSNTLADNSLYYVP